MDQGPNKTHMAEWWSSGWVERNAKDCTKYLVVLKLLAMRFLAASVGVVGRKGSTCGEAACSDLEEEEQGIQICGMAVLAV